MTEDVVKITGITGGIGAGKSVVSRILRLKGFEVYDCDYHAHRIMETAEEIVLALKERFGEACYIAEGKLDRRFLAERIFSDVEERMWLNSLVHSAVREDIKVWHSKIAGRIEAGSKERMARTFRTIFVESAILHSSGLDELCNEIWVVDASEEVRMARALKRGGIEKEDLKRRIASQNREIEGMPPERVRLIDNSGKIGLLSQIDNLLYKRE